MEMRWKPPSPERKPHRLGSQLSGQAGGRVLPQEEPTGDSGRSLRQVQGWEEGPMAEPRSQVALGAADSGRNKVCSEDSKNSPGKHRNTQRTRHKLT